MKRSVAIGVAVLLVLVVSASSGPAPDGVAEPQLSAIETFIAGHPAVVIWIWGSVLSLLATLVAVIVYLGKRSLDAFDAANKEFRADLQQGIENHAEDVRKLYEAMQHQNAAMDIKWERLFSELQSQGKALAQLQGEHSVLSKHHTFAMQRLIDRPSVTHAPENGEGD
jgi:hypothetical protein